MPNIAKLRTADIVTGKSDLEPLASYRLPVFQGCTLESPRLDQIVDIEFDISQGSGMIQVRNLLDLNTVYQQTHNPGTVGTTWQRHHREFAEFIAQYDPQHVVEIGGAHGILSRNYLDSKPQVDWTIIDPHAQTDGRAKTIRDFYTANTVLDADVDAVVHSHVLEHIYEPSEFFGALGQLRPGVRLIFSIPALSQQLKLKYASALSFEHVYLCSEPYVEYWLNVNGFELLNKQFFNNDHSIFYSAIKTDQPLPAVPLPGCYESNKSLFEEYMAYYQRVIAQINRTTNRAESPVYLFGANIISQYLLVNGLDHTNIKAILDNDITKQGRRLYGTSLNVLPPRILQGQTDPIVILKAGAYSQEVKEDILQNINGSAIIIE